MLPSIADAYETYKYGIYDGTICEIILLFKMRLLIILIINMSESLLLFAMQLLAQNGSI